MIAFKLRVYMLAVPWNVRESSQMGLLNRVAPTFGFEVVILLYDLIMIPMYTAFPLAPNLFLDMMTGKAVEPLKARHQHVVEDVSRNNRINPARVDLVHPLFRFGLFTFKNNSRYSGVL